MPKLKTKSSVKKRFSLTASGKVRASQAGHKHNMRKRSKRSLRNSVGTTILSDADAGIIIPMMPYAR